MTSPISKAMMALKFIAGMRAMLEKVIPNNLRQRDHINLLRRRQYPEIDRIPWDDLLGLYLPVRIGSIAHQNLETGGGGGNRTLE